MFSFHKPKVYRSSTGCCICKAKSSSSRFTDSRKYEQDFLPCFQLASPRKGEICNACVLLVKRWKKLPTGSERNWKHVVDARAGPGMKSMTKFKAKNKHRKGSSPNEGNNEKSNEPSAETTEKHKKKHKYVRRTTPLISETREMSPALSDGDTTSEDALSSPPSRADSPVIVDGVTGNRRCNNKHKFDYSNFIDVHFWKRQVVCCGVIFKGPNGEIMIDERYFKPCQLHSGQNSSTAPDSSNCVSAAASPEPAAVQKTKSFSDSSSDSGYDESSNQGNEKPVSSSDTSPPPLVPDINIRSTICH